MAEVVEKTETTQEGQNTVKTPAQVLEALEGNKFNIYFFSPGIDGPSGGMGVLFKQALILKEAGYNVTILYQPTVDKRATAQFRQAAAQQGKTDDQTIIFFKHNPRWMEFSLFETVENEKGVKEERSIVDFIPLGEGTMRFSDGTVEEAQNLNLNTEDFLIIPEGFPNIMQETMHAPCKRIVLAQSWIYILNALAPGQKWNTFGITDAISVSDGITEYLSSIMPQVKVKQYSQSINREIFNAPDNLSDKFPMIAYSAGRGQDSEMKINNVIRNFQEWYPQYKFFRFMKLNDLSRKEYAERLKSCCIALYTDDIAGFGTLPLEAMASGTHVVGWTPFGGKEYINKAEGEELHNGFWANNGDVFNLSEVLGVAVDKWVNGELDGEELQEAYDKTLSRYTDEKENSRILDLYNEYKTERINEIKGLQAK